jgi:hypothetical protein
MSFSAWSKHLSAYRVADDSENAPCTQERVSATRGSRRVCDMSERKPDQWFWSGFAFNRADLPISGVN